MEARAKISDHAARQRSAPIRVPASPHSKDARAAEIDELKTGKRDTSENPLWVINIAMAVFFIVTALVMMIS